MSKISAICFPIATGSLYLGAIAGLNIRCLPECQGLILNVRHQHFRPQTFCDIREAAEPASERSSKAWPAEHPIAQNHPWQGFE